MTLRCLSRRGLAAGLAALPLLSRHAQGEATLRVLCTGATEAVLADLTRRFTAETGQGVVLDLASPGSMGRRLREGERIDLVVSNARQLAAMAGAGLLDGTTLTEIGRMRLGVAASAGAARPTVDSVEALRATLLAAPSLAFADPASTPTGVHLLRMLDSLGIGAATAPRRQYFYHGLEAVRAVADGQASLALAQLSEILGTPGVVLAGPLPEPLNLVSPYGAAVAARAAHPAQALALLRRLGRTDSRARFREAGFQLAS